MRNNKKITIISRLFMPALMYAAFICGCKSTDDPPVDQAAQMISQDFLEGRKFVSRSGEYIGDDGDYILKFKANGFVSLEIDSLGQSIYEGSYQLDKQSRLVKLQLKDYSD